MAGFFVSKMMEIKDWEYKWKNKEAYSQRALFWINLANSRLNEFNRQLLGLATILLPLTGSIAITDIALTESQRAILVSAWILLFLSMIFGLVQVVIDANYFKNLSRDSNKREAIWANFSRPSHDLEGETKKLGTVDSQSTHIPLSLQVFTLFVGILLIMIVAISILFIN